MSCFNPVVKHVVLLGCIVNIRYKNSHFQARQTLGVFISQPQKGNLVSEAWFSTAVMAAPHGPFTSSHPEDPLIFGQVARGISKVVRAGSTQLDSKVFEAWYLALKYNQEPLVRRVISESSPEEAGVLIGGEFLYPTAIPGSLTQPLSRDWREAAPTLGWRRPWFVAAGFGSVRTFELLSKTPHIDVLSTDVNGANILHALVLSAVTARERNEDYITMYKQLMEMVDLDMRTCLLSQENEDGYRPLELATKSGVLELSALILQEDSVYRFTKLRVGLCTEVWYDVTDYEGQGHQNRRGKSPLRLLKYNYSDGGTSNANLDSFLRLNIIQSWARKRSAIHAPYWVIVMFLRLLLNVVIVLAGPAKQTVFDMTDSRPNNTITCTSTPYPLQGPGQYSGLIHVVIVGLLLPFDIFDAIHYIFNSVKGSRVTDVPWRTRVQSFQRLSQGILTVYVILKCILSRAPRGLVVHLATVYDMGDMFCLVLAIWSSVLFLLALRPFALYRICIVDMLYVMAKFLPIFLLFFTSFALVFENIATSSNGCMGYFSDDSIYGTFLVMLNLINLGETDGNSNLTIRAAHILFIFTVPIMLLNFLIGLMTDVVSRVNNQGNTRYLLNHIASVNEVERYVGWCSGSTRFLKRRCFVHEKGRIFIAVFEVNRTGNVAMETSRCTHNRGRSHEAYAC